MVRQGEEFRVFAPAGLPPEVLRRLTRLSPLRSALSLVQTWSLSSAARGRLALSSTIVIGAALVGLAGQQHGLAILAHQAAHYWLFETRWLNDLCGRLCGWPIGVALVAYRVAHLIHHNQLNSE